MSAAAVFQFYYIICPPRPIVDELTALVFHMKTHGNHFTNHRIMNKIDNKIDIRMKYIIYK